MGGRRVRKPRPWPRDRTGGAGTPTPAPGGRERFISSSTLYSLAAGLKYLAILLVLGWTLAYFTDAQGQGQASGQQHQSLSGTKSGAPTIQPQKDKKLTYFLLGTYNHTLENDEWDFGKVYILHGNMLKVPGSTYRYATGFTYAEAATACPNEFGQYSFTLNNTAYLNLSFVNDDADNRELHIFNSWINFGKATALTCNGIQQMDENSKLSVLCYKPPKPLMLKNLVCGKNCNLFDRNSTVDPACSNCIAKIPCGDILCDPNWGQEYCNNETVSDCGSECKDLPSPLPIHTTDGNNLCCENDAQCLNPMDPGKSFCNTTQKLCQSCNNLPAGMKEVGCSCSSHGECKTGLECHTLNNTCFNCADLKMVKDKTNWIQMCPCSDTDDCDAKNTTSKGLYFCNTTVERNVPGHLDRCYDCSKVVGHRPSGCGCHGAHSNCNITAGQRCGNMSDTCVDCSPGPNLSPDILIDCKCNSTTSDCQLGGADFFCDPTKASSSNPTGCVKCVDSNKPEGCQCTDHLQCDQTRIGTGPKIQTLKCNLTKYNPNQANGTCIKCNLGPDPLNDDDCICLLSITNTNDCKDGYVCHVNGTDRECKNCMDLSSPKPTNCGCNQITIGPMSIVQGNHSQCDSGTGDVQKCLVNPNNPSQFICVDCNTPGAIANNPNCACGPVGNGIGVGVGCRPDQFCVNPPPADTTGCTNCNSSNTQRPSGCSCTTNDHCDNHTIPGNPLPVPIPQICAQNKCVDCSLQTLTNTINQLCACMPTDSSTNNLTAPQCKANEVCIPPTNPGQTSTSGCVSCAPEPKAPGCKCDENSIPKHKECDNGTVGPSRQICLNGTCVNCESTNPFAAMWCACSAPNGVGPNAGCRDGEFCTVPIPGSGNPTGCTNCSVLITNRPPGCSCTDNTQCDNYTIPGTQAPIRQICDQTQMKCVNCSQDSTGQIDPLCACMPTDPTKNILTAPQCQANEVCVPPQNPTNVSGCVSCAPVPKQAGCNCTQHTECDNGQNQNDTRQVCVANKCVNCGNANANDQYALMNCGCPSKGSVGPDAGCRPDEFCTQDPADNPPTGCKKCVDGDKRPPNCSCTNNTQCDGWIANTNPTERYICDNGICVNCSYEKSMQSPCTCTAAVGQEDKMKCRVGEVCAEVSDTGPKVCTSCNTPGTKAPGCNCSSFTDCNGWVHPAAAASTTSNPNPAPSTDVYICASSGKCVNCKAGQPLLQPNECQCNMTKTNVSTSSDLTGNDFGCNSNSFCEKLGTEQNPTGCTDCVGLTTGRARGCPCSDHKECEGYNGRWQKCLKDQFTKIKTCHDCGMLTYDKIGQDVFHPDCKCNETSDVKTGEAVNCQDNTQYCMIGKMNQMQLDENPSGCLNCTGITKNKLPLIQGCPCTSHEDCVGTNDLCVKKGGKYQCITCDPNGFYNQNPNPEECRCYDTKPGNKYKNRCRPGFACPDFDSFGSQHYHLENERDSNYCVNISLLPHLKYPDVNCTHDRDCKINYHTSGRQYLVACEYRYNKLPKPYIERGKKRCNLHCGRGIHEGICIKCPLMYTTAGNDFDVNSPKGEELPEGCNDKCSAEDKFDFQTTDEWDNYCLPQMRCNEVTKTCSCTKRLHCGDDLQCVPGYNEHTSNGPFCTCTPEKAAGDKDELYHFSKECKFQRCYNKANLIKEKKLNKKRNYGGTQRDIYNEEPYATAIEQMSSYQEFRYCTGITESTSYG